MRPRVLVRHFKSDARVKNLSVWHQIDNVSNGRRAVFCWHRSGDICIIELRDDDVQIILKRRIWKIQRHVATFF